MSIQLATAGLSQLSVWYSWNPQEPGHHTNLMNTWFWFWGKNTYHGNVHLNCHSRQQTTQVNQWILLAKHFWTSWCFPLVNRGFPLVESITLWTTKTGGGIFSTTWKLGNIAPFKSSIIRDVFLVEICWKSHLYLGVKSCYFVDFGRLFLDVLGLNFMGQRTNTWMVS